MDRNSRVFVAGADKPLGAAIARALIERGYRLVPGEGGRRADLTSLPEVRSLFREASPTHVVMAAGKSGGIGMNRKHPADLMLDNLVIESNIIGEAHRAGVEKLLYLASSCCYPRLCPQPMKEEYLFTGPLEPTNEAYAMAKLAGLMLCRAFSSQYGSPFISAIPTNYFGPGDDLDEENSHVVTALMVRTERAMEEKASSLEVWGTGKARREFMFIDDVADAVIFLLERYDSADPVNIGSGEALSIADLAEMIKEIAGFGGEILFDPTKPDGMPVKILDRGRLDSLGWKGRTTMRQGLGLTYEWLRGLRTGNFHKGRTSV
ncbi:MAG: GDP-L-fucose synthase [Candidatus Eremiobacteraeota bacterium]|nr:GDP-L-fucose synthase [Candidatus Eremiobacteraeota bacterium]